MSAYDGRCPRLSQVSVSVGNLVPSPLAFSVYGDQTPDVLSNFKNRNQKILLPVSFYACV